jgi:hypothetical protein
MPINYALGKIYKIVDNTNDQCYVGSTCEPILARRLAGHVAQYNSYLNGKQHYISSFDILKNGDYDIILIENFPCGNKDELHARERHWSNEIPCVNKIKNQGIWNEIGQVEYDRRYFELNGDKIKERLHQKCHCICGGKFTVNGKSQHLKTKKHFKYIEQQADEEEIIEV